MILIDIEHKILTSGGNRLLKISAEIPVQSFTCVFGHSGAGKTTLLRMIAGLSSPDKGLIKIGDSVVFDSEKKINQPPQKRNIGFMFQDYALFPNMTVEENISFAQSDSNRDKEFVSKLMNVFGLEALKNQKPVKLSGGQKQRTALARALAGKPQILLLDEPLSAIDMEMRKVIQQEIMKAHQQYSFTTLMVSHNQEEIKNMGDYILILGQDQSEMSTIKKEG